MSNHSHPEAIPTGSFEQVDHAASNFTESRIASGEKGKARDIIAAIRVLQAVEREGRRATDHEKAALARFAGFGPVALSIFPDPVTGRYKDEGWRVLGEELQSLLSPAEYDSKSRRPHARSG